MIIDVVVAVVDVHRCRMLPDRCYVSLNAHSNARAYCVCWCACVCVSARAYAVNMKLEYHIYKFH